MQDNEKLMDVSADVTTPEPDGFGNRLMNLLVDEMQLIRH